jgi:hypothetical protein
MPESLAGVPFEEEIEAPEAPEEIPRTVGISPPVLGTPAQYTSETFGRDWSKVEPRVPWTNPAVRAPIVRAVRIEDDDARMVTGARTLARAARAAGWNAHVTYALGWEVDNSGREATDDVMEPTGEYTDKGRARTHKIGERARDAVPSVLVRAFRTAECGDGIVRTVEFLSAHWINGRWDSGLTGANSRGVTFGDLRAHATLTPVKEFLAEMAATTGGEQLTIVVD